VKRRRLLIYIFSFFYPLSAFPQQTPSGVGDAIRRARELYNQPEQQAPSPQQTSSNYGDAMRRAKEFFDKESAAQPATDFNKSGFNKYLMSDYDFLAAATSSDENQNRFPHCQAWYYCGLRQLLSFLTLHPRLGPGCL
jgi:hypothetical protein